MQNRSLSLVDAPHIKRKLKLYNYLNEIKALHLAERVIKGKPGPIVGVAYSNPPKAKNRKAVNNEKFIYLSSYNYSGLSDDPRVIAAAHQALDEYGPTTSGVRLLNGTNQLHIELERRLAKFLGTEAAITYSSGFSANLAALSTVIGKNDLVFFDDYSHQSIYDGLKLTPARTFTYKHNDMNELKQHLESAGLEQRKFIIMDGIFSMEGDTAPLKNLVDLAYRFNCFIIVDEAHATAAYGPNGRGVVAAQNLTNEIDLITGSLSKGLPGVGGFVAGKQEIINILRYGSNPYIFSASLPAPVCASLIEAINILEDEPEIQAKLHFNENYLREGLKRIGLKISEGSETPIIPVIFSDPNLVVEFCSQLHEQGIFANVVMFPAVPKDSPRIRLNASACFSKEDLDQALSVFSKVLKNLGLA